VEGASRLILVIKRKQQNGQTIETPYRLRFLASDPSIGQPAWRLEKPDGTHYNVILTPTGAECTCPDWVWARQNQKAPCKHVRALEVEGLLKGV
jgi:hypothetical protein